MKIAVLSRNPKLFSTLRLIEEIHKAGHDALVVDHSLCDLIIEQEGPSIIYKGQKLESIDAIIPRIGASVTFYGTAVVRQFELMGAFSAVTSQAIVRRGISSGVCKSFLKMGWVCPKQPLLIFQKEGKSS
jgi:ribosomal protein S6--L-glutamate ligase